MSAHETSVLWMPSSQRSALRSHETTMSVVSLPPRHSSVAYEFVAGDVVPASRLLTEAGDVRITESGDTRVTE